VAEPIERTYRWRRREVVRTRITWVGLVTMLLLLIHKQITTGMPMTPKAAWFIAVVVVPVIALLLWRAGLLPPERVLVDGEVPAEPPGPSGPAPSDPNGPAQLDAPPRP
jgi:hypothetical protein